MTQPPPTEQIALTIPEFALVVLIGISGSGKSTLARTLFRDTEILCSDTFRGMVSDDENDLSATDAAFDALHYVLARRLAGRRLTVVDATNVQASARKPLVQLAKEYHALPVAIVLDVPESLCRRRNESRPDRDLPHRVIGQQRQQLRRSLKSLKREGFNRIFVLKSEEEISRVDLQREKLWNDRSEESGPFDIIGDIHGCFDELSLLLAQLGYSVRGTRVEPLDSRKVIFLGDLVDRGPKTPEVIDLVMDMVDRGLALCLPGNHDVKLMRALSGRKVVRTHGLEETLSQLASAPAEQKKRIETFIYSLVSHYVLDEGKLVVAHAGMKEEMAGRASRAVREFAMYGQTTGESDEFGLPVRQNWAADYRGDATVVYGHTPVPGTEWLNNTINIDTGCAFGGSLTALRYPEKEIVSVPAARTYADPVRPLEVSTGDVVDRTSQQQHDDLLDIADVLGTRRIDTRLIPRIGVREENAAAALEIISRFTVDPRWLIYLPPTMSPTETSGRPDLLEHPLEAFDYFRRADVGQVVCQEKHMGSRAIVVVCRDEETAQRRFGLLEERGGICYTRTGRAFFDQPDTETYLLGQLRTGIAEANLWSELSTDWMILDCELMPWSARGLQLIENQYAAVGAAATAALAEVDSTLQRAAARGQDMDALQSANRTRRDQIERYVNTYRRYCWAVDEPSDLKLAPFHLLATETAVHVDETHQWHMDIIDRIAAAAPHVVCTTERRSVDLDDETSEREATEWWTGLTDAGGEGMVIKPSTFLATRKGRPVQPAVKCRGREYLRIIYGPEYTDSDSISRLKSRNLRAKRSLALREFALGVEALERFVSGQPLRAVHECVFAVLALESEPVDPRL